MAKKLYRSTTDRGLPEYAAASESTSRSTRTSSGPSGSSLPLTGFLPGIIVYILLWIILPEQGQARPVGTTAEV